MKLDKTIHIEETDKHSLIDQAFRKNNIPPQSYYTLDDKLHRFKVSEKKQKNGWYRLGIDPFNGAVWGAFGNWEEGSSIKYCDGGTDDNLTPEQILYRQKVIEEQKRYREELRREEVEQASITATNTYNNIAKLPQDDPKDILYLNDKNITDVPNDVLLHKSNIYIPLYNISYNKIKSLQTISYDETEQQNIKRYTQGSDLKNTYYFYKYDCFNSATICYVCEGWATGYSIAQNTDNSPIVCAMSSQNLSRAVDDIKEQFPKCKVVIIADNDKNEVGLKKAQETKADKIILIPKITKDTTDANDYVNNGGDLRKLLQENEIKTEFQNLDDIIDNFKPIRWLVKNWIEEQSLFMLQGASGTGKTFIVLDMLFNVATGGNWLGQKVKKNSVLYLCGEGFEGVKIRAKAWQHYNDDIKGFGGNFYTFNKAVDFDTEEGLQEIVRNIDLLEKPPKLIVFDTLNRYMRGDENKATDVRVFLNNCKVLQDKYKATVGIIHHTGWDEETASTRGRGSSAWRGALETDINLKKNTEGVITLSQVKQKNGELKAPIYCSLHKVYLDLFDEDNEQITSCYVAQEDAPSTTELKEVVKPVVTNKLEKERIESSLKYLLEKYPNGEVPKNVFKSEMSARLEVNEKTIERYLRENIFKNTYDIMYDFEEKKAELGNSKFIKISVWNDEF